jgi:hypothetical protein
MRHDLNLFRPYAFRCENALKAIDAATQSGLDTPQSLKTAAEVVAREGQHLEHYPKMALLRILNDPSWQAAIKQAAPDQRSLRALYAEARDRSWRLDQYPMLRAALGNLPRDVAADVAALRGAARRLLNVGSNKENFVALSRKSGSGYARSGGGSYRSEVIDIWNSPNIQNNPFQWAAIFLLYSMEALGEALDRLITPSVASFCARYLACLRDADARHAACLQSAQGQSNPLIGSVGANIGAEAACAGQCIIDKSVCILKAYAAGVTGLPSKP